MLLDLFTAVGTALLLANVPCAASEYIGPKVYTITNVMSNTSIILDPNTGLLNGSPSNPNSRLQQWQIAEINKNVPYGPDPSNVYTVVIFLNVATGLAIPGYRPNSPNQPDDQLKATTLSFTYNDDSNRWRMYTQGSHLQFQSHYPQRGPYNVLDLAGGNATAGTPILNYPRNNGQNQLWDLTPIMGFD